ncbi:MAG: WG repeat-containing protein [Clostridia bacterium]|nr:WG repeat-containing protein [Clostridia bacterium]
MRIIRERFARVFKTILQLALIFGAALLVLLYYLGFYDFSFLDRYKDQLDLLRAGETVRPDTSSDPFAALAESLSRDGRDPGDGDPSAPAPGVGQPGDRREDGSEPASSAPAEGENGENAGPEKPTNLRTVYAADDLPDERVRIPTVSELTASGKRFSSPTVVYKPGLNTVGRVTFDFQLPETYSETWRHNTYYILKRVDPDNEDSELVPRTATYIEQRPKVDLYMGYILVENGEKTVVVSSDGEPLCSFPTGRYEPALCRDRGDRPLFVRERNNGTRIYFYLSEDGKNFVVSDYDPETDGRGLNFDYPADYGRADSDRVYLDEDPETGLFGYRIPVEYMPEPEPIPVPEPEPEGPEEDAEAPQNAESGPEGEEGAEEEPEPEPEPQPGYLTPYQYRYALQFSEGAAAVTAAEPIPTYYYVDADGKPLFPYREWSTLDKVYNVYGNEDHSFVNNSGIDRSVLYFIREDGEPLFPAGRMFKNDQDRKVFGSAQLPYSFGVESLGSFYFDHGLVRVRWQVIDFWRYFQRRNYTGSQIKVMEEYDALLREDGTMFEIPFGYKLEGYSEGRLLLSRDGFFGIFSVTGEWIAQPIYGGGKPYVEGLAQLMTPDGRWGMIDTEGNIVLPFTYDKISGVSSGLVSCYREENGWSILRIMQ